MNFPEDFRRPKGFHRSSVGTLESARWRPAADVYRARDGWLLKLELAGVSAEDIRLAIRGSRLHVEGERRDWTIDDRHEHQSLEIRYSHFELRQQMRAIQDELGEGRPEAAETTDLRKRFEAAEPTVSTWPAPARSSTKTITASKRSRSASSSIWR